MTGVTAGTKVAIDCTGLPALHPMLVLQASLLIGIDPKAAALLSGGAPGPGTIESALAALPEIDPGSFTVQVPDINGNLNFNYTVPSIQPTDPNATCPPSEQQFNSGLIGCALAMVDLTTQAPVAAGSGVLEYAGYPFFPPPPTIALSAKKASVGSTVSVTDAPGATTYWWVATLATLEALLSGGGAPPITVTVNFEHKGNFVSAANNITVTPATYDGTTFTPPAISGGFTVPPGVKGKQKVYFLLTAELDGVGLSNIVHKNLTVKK